MLTSNVNLVDPPPPVRTPSWDGTLATYAAIRDMVGPGPDGRPGFVAGMLTASRPGPARLWSENDEWVRVPLGWTVVIDSGYTWAERPPEEGARDD